MFHRARHRLGFAACAVVLACVAVGAEPGKLSAQEKELKQVREELASLRVELAKAKLDLQRAVAEVEDLREFLASEDADGQAAAWRAEREKLATERQALVEERREVEGERRRARFEAENPQPTATPEEQAAKPRYDLEYTLSYIRESEDERPIYIEFGDLLVPVESEPNIDRKHVMVRGTMRNLSSEPWRYTFEVRVGDRQGNPLGKWRYQTPELGPRELHPFEIKVPVTDANLVGQYQIGKIEPDRAEEEE